MSKWIRGARGALMLLGVATGAVKLVGMDEEMRLFASAGFSTGATIAFGALQLGAALLVALGRTRRLGALLLGLSFLVATAVVFLNGMVAFGAFSLLFIALAGVVARTAGPPGDP